METLFAISLVAWIVTYLILDNQIKSLDNEITRLREIIRKYERDYRTRIR